MKLFLYFCLYFFVEAKLFGQTSSGDPWLAFGDLRGYFEPCGCDPRTDLGGVQRLDAYLRRERMQHSNLRIFHLGNAYSSDSSNTAQQKNSSIRAALGVVSPDVSLLNRAELLQGSKMLPTIPYVLSNHKAKAPSSMHYQPYLKVGAFVVFGFVEPFKEYRNLEPFQVKQWQQRKKADPLFKAKSLLLFSGSRKVLKTIVNTNIFDVVIASNDWAWGKDYSDAEKKDENRLVVYHDSRNEVLQVPMAGQGVIRGPALQLIAPAKPLAQVIVPSLGKTCSDQLLTSDCTNSAPLAGISANRSLVTWLSPAEDSGVSSDMQEVVARFRIAASSAMDELAKNRSADIANTNFVGSEVCSECHSSAYKKWSESKHAGAFGTIQKLARDRDPECVSCHVLGFYEKGGFVSESKSPKFMNVQCENCHGARKDHINNQSAKGTKVGKEVCSTCHTPPHSPNFEYSKYWKTIEHK